MTTIIQILKPYLIEAKNKKRGRKSTKQKAVKVNRRTELFYTRQLLQISKFCQEQADSIVLPVVGNNVGDSWATDIIAALRVKITSYGNAVSRQLATTVVSETQKEVDKQIADHTQKVIGVDLTQFYRASDIQDEVTRQIEANVALIKSIPSQYADKLGSLIMTGLQTGQTNSEIKDAIKNLGQSTDARARLIASDQMGKINGQINKARQISLGVETYTWLDSRDDRVRPLCSSHNGKTFRWDTPPKGGHPGQKVRCRCTSLPNYEDILIE